MPVIPISRGPTTSTRAKPDDPYILMAAAQMAQERAPPLVTSKSSQSPEEQITRSQGSVRFDPEQGSEGSKGLLKNLPDDIERIDRGNTIELRMKKASEAATS